MKDKFDKQTAVIVGMELNGLGVTRALASQQIPCIALATPSWNPACQTKSCKVIHSTSWTKEGVINDLKLIGRRLKKRAPLIITKDEPVLWISESRNELSEFYEINLPNNDIVNLLMDKQCFLKMSLRKGWPVPHTWIIKDKDELMSCLKEIVYPCILKPAVKNSTFRKNSPHKAFKLHNMDSLVQTYNMVEQWEKEVILQEWIEGGDERVAFCLAYYDRNNKPLSLFPGRKIRQWPVECGNTAIAEPAPKDWVEPITELTKSIFQEVKYSGLGSVEFKMRKNSNEPVIMEPTVGRTNWQNEVAVINGQNIPAIAYFDLIGKRYNKIFLPQKPCKLINSTDEIKAAWKYYCSGRLTIRQWINDRKGKKKYMTLRVNDFGPFVASIYLTAKVVLAKCITVLLGNKVKEKLKVIFNR